MKTRTIHELLILLKEEYLKTIEDDGFSRHGGLCETVIDLCCSGIISADEETLLLDYINEFPTKRAIKKAKKLGCNPEYIFYWEEYVPTYRLKWLDKHIKLTA